VSSRDVIKLLEAHGWVLARVRGDHHHYKHPRNPHLVTVPHPVKDLTIGVLRSIERATGLRLRK